MVNVNETKSGNKKIQNDGHNCDNCGYKFYYEANRCPVCSEAMA